MPAEPSSLPERREDRGPAPGFFSGAGFRLGRLAGVEIQVDWSLALIFALVTFNLGAGLFPRWHPGWTALQTWGTALGAAVLFFASVLLHELSHAVVARAQDIPVPRITLFLFGGMAHMEREPHTPKAEFLIAIVGPITSVAIGVVAIFAGLSLGGQSFNDEMLQDPEGAFQTLAPLPTLLLWLGPVNVLLGVFNVLPGFPLDGGRVLRATLWWITSDLVKATRWAMGSGLLMAWLLMAWGIFSLFSGAFAQGLWLLLIGWFLSTAARASYRDLLVRQTLRGVTVDRVMLKHLSTVAPDLPMETFVRKHLMASDQRAFPVEADGRLVGLVCVDDVRKVPSERWPETPLSEVMTPVDQLLTLPPDAAAERALDGLAKKDIDQIPVLSDGHLLGMVRQRDLVKWVMLQGPEGDALRA